MNSSELKFTFEEKYVGLYTYNIDKNNLQLLVPDQYRYGFDSFSVSLDGNYIAYSIHPFGYILNRLTRETQKFSLLNTTELQSELVGVNSFYWGNMGKWLFVLSNDTISDPVVNVMNMDYPIQREIGICSLSKACFGWMPQ